MVRVRLDASADRVPQHISIVNAQMLFGLERDLYAASADSASRRRRLGVALPSGEINFINVATYDVTTNRLEWTSKVVYSGGVSTIPSDTQPPAPLPLWLLAVISLTVGLLVLLRLCFAVGRRLSNWKEAAELQERKKDELVEAALQTQRKPPGIESP